jgi:hypothetical protein
LLLLVFFVSWLGYYRKPIYSGSTLHVRVMCCGLPFGGLVQRRMRTHEVILGCIQLHT